METSFDKLTDANNIVSTDRSKQCSRNSVVPEDRLIRHAGKGYVWEHWFEAHARTRPIDSRNATYQEWQLCPKHRWTSMSA